MLRIEGKNVEGALQVPPSKSVTHRALISAALSNNECRIVSALDCEDIRATMQCLRALGTNLLWTDTDVTLRGGIQPQADARLDCRESGATLRFMLPVCAALGGRYNFVLAQSLAVRPHSEMRGLMQAEDIQFYEQKDGFTIEGKMVEPDAYVEGKVTSQITSGFLLAMPLCGGRVHPGDMPVSGNYIALTRDVMRAYGAVIERDDTAKDTTYVCKHGYTGCPEYVVEGDWSQAAFYFAMKQEVGVKGLNRESRQGDMRILDILRDMGAVIIEKNGVISTRFTKLRAIEVDVSDVPDLAPPLACIMSQAEGTSRMVGGARLRGKESNRLSSSAELLRTLGIRVEMDGDGLTITGGKLHGGEVSSWQDHRIAMMAATCSTWTDESIVVDNHACVNKSYPTFWEDFESIGGKISREF